MLTQIISVTWINLRSISQRRASSLVAIVGAAGVVGVLLAMLAMANGFAQTMQAAGRTDRVIIMRGGSTSELSSALAGNAIDIIRTTPGISKSNNRLLFSPQVVVILDLPLRETGTAANVSLRGVTEGQYAILDQFAVVAGRRPTPGKRELIAGRTAAKQFAGLEVGQRVGTGTNSWEVVGIFAEGGSVRESEVWADAAVVQDAYRRGNSYSSVLLQLNRAEIFKEFKNTLDNDPRLDVSVERETRYYAAQSGMLRKFIEVIGYSIAVIMAFGAIFAALNTMYSSIASRSSEIATLRALGFGGTAVLVSVLVEAMLLSLIGGIIGGVIAYLAFNGLMVSTINFASFSQVAFAFQLTPALFAVGLVWALVIGFIGGLFPAVRAVRTSVTQALRPQ